MRGYCSNAVLRFEFICNKCQCLLIICFIFGSALLFDFGFSNASVSISDNR